MTEGSVLTIILSMLPCFVIALIAGRFIIPWLRAMKAGQTIREIGPKWHASKAGTPSMGGLIFILTALIGTVVLCAITKTWTSAFVFAFALVFGAIGFLDDYFKVKKKQNLGLKAWQKMALQLLASALYLFLLYKAGHMTASLWIPFTAVRWSIPIWVYIPFAVFVIVGTVNAVNLTDGVDGLATGVRPGLCPGYAPDPDSGRLRLHRRDRFRYHAGELFQADPRQADLQDDADPPPL